MIGRVEKAWGVELVIANRSGFCGKVMLLREGYRCSLHYHAKKDETFHVTTGMMRVEIGESGRARDPDAASRLRVIDVYAGESIDVPPLTLHRFTGLLGVHSCEFVEFSSTDDPKDSFRLEESGAIPR